MSTPLPPGSPPLDDARLPAGLPTAGARGGRSRRSRHSDTYWQRSTAHVTPITLLFFVGAAIAFQRSALEGDADREFILGVLLLSLSIVLPLVSRLRARRAGLPTSGAAVLPG